jgi:hypothetical protein
MLFLKGFYLSIPGFFIGIIISLNLGKILSLILEEKIGEV